MGYNVPTQILWPGKRVNAPRPWPNGGYPVDAHDFTPVLSEDDIARFWSLVDQSAGPDACWPFMGTRDEDGYGRFKAKGTTYRAHRIALALSIGSIPAGKLALHRCDNPPCCNPRCLWPGTNAENLADRDAKGRQARGERHGLRVHPEARSRGAANGGARIDEPDVLVILGDLADGMNLCAISRRRGISRSQVRRIRDGQSWAHVTARPAPAVEGRTP